MSKVMIFNFKMSRDLLLISSRESRNMAATWKAGKEKQTRRDEWSERKGER